MASKEEILHGLLRQIAYKELEAYKFYQGHVQKETVFLYVNNETASISRTPPVRRYDIAIPIGITTAGAEVLFGRTYTMDLIMDIIQGHIGDHTFDEKAASAIESLTEILK